jgi:hypothetical protein
MERVLMCNLSREQQVKSVNRIKELYSESDFYYLLTHEYDYRLTPVYVKSKIHPWTMELLIAFIQFVADYFKHAYSLHQSDLANLLVKHFDGEVLDYRPYRAINEDLYQNWEEWCGIANQITNINKFNKPELIEDIKKLVREDKG